MTSTPDAPDEGYPDRDAIKRQMEEAEEEETECEVEEAQEAIEDTDRSIAENIG